MPPRGQKRSYKIESMYYTLPTTKKKYCHQESSLHLCAQEGSRNISRSYFNFNCLKNKQTNKQTHFPHSIIIHLKGTRQN